MSADTPTPRIYVASLSDYNAGRLHGAWIDATERIEEIWRQVQSILTSSQELGAEEIAIHDHEGFWPAEVGEYESLEYIHRLAAGIAAHGLAFAHWVAVAEPDAELDEQTFVDQYLGHWDSMREYASDLLDDIFDAYEQAIPDVLRPYIRCDVEAFAQDLVVITSMSQDDSGVYVFDTR